MRSKIGGVLVVLGALVAGLAAGATLPGGFAVAVGGGLIAVAGLTLASSK